MSVARTKAPLFLSVKEVAEDLEVTPSAVYQMIRRGKLSASRKTTGRIRISRAALNAYHRLHVLGEPMPQVPRANVADPELRIAMFQREVGLTPREWLARWKADEIEDTSENMRRTIIALALARVESPAEDDATQSAAIEQSARDLVALTSSVTH